MPYLDDGSVIPSWLAVAASDDGSQAYEYNFNNTTLRTGYVVGVHYPGDIGYETEKVASYDVAVWASLGAEPRAWQIYRNAKLALRIGGTSQEYSSMSLRTPKNWSAEVPLSKELLDETTCVYIECEDGRSEAARIVGFWDHPDLAAEAKVDGHYWLQKFNGIISQVNKDGEYSVTFSGAILDPGTNFHIKPPENTTGTFFRFSKDGNFAVDDVRGESITLDKTNKKVVVLARGMDTNITESDYNLTTKGKVNVKATGNAIFDGAKVYAGKEGSSDPMVKGNELVAALDKLVSAFLNAPLIGQAGTIPCFLHPSLKGKLQAWKSTYGKKTAPFLSKKGFVE